METNVPQTIESRMAERGDRPVLTLRHELESAVLRYAVGEERKGTYSIYVEYAAKGNCTTELIPAFSRDRDVAEGFCSVLARFSATPLSLLALYEDSLTP